jgi:transcriptional regulator with XRE-family HTH domain
MHSPLTSDYVAFVGDNVNSASVAILPLGDKLSISKKSDSPMNVGQLIKAGRESRQLTLADLEKLSGISSSVLNRIENSQRDANADIAIMVAPHIGVDVHVLLTAVGRPLGKAKPLPALSEPHARAWAICEARLSDLPESARAMVLAGLDGLLAAAESQGKGGR